MSQSEGGASRRRRQYVARACNSCRRRRCKCDGGQPVCGPCSTSGHECTWGTDGEDSGRPATKQFVESLRVKVQQLESEIAQLKREPLQTQSPLDIPSHLSNSLSGLGPGSTELPWDVTDTPPITGFIQALPEAHPEVRTPIMPPSSNVDSSGPVHQSLPQPYSLPEPHQPIRATQFAPVKVSVVNLPPFVPSIRYQYIFNIDTTLPLDEQYPPHRASLICQWNRYFPDLSPAQLTRFEHDIILFRCLTYGASCSFGLIPDLFLAELLERLAPETAHAYPPVDYHYYTPLLHCSLMAFGSGYSDSPEIRARETRAKFAAHAKQWLDQEFERPSPSLMVSLALLSEYHSGVGERNLGHMYMGMAVRAARAQCLMALEINKPSEMPVPRVPISCPMASESDNRPPMTDSPMELLNHVDYFKYSAQCFIQMCKLTVIAARMIDHPVNDAQDMLDIHLQLETWFNNLPEGVLIRQRATLTFPPVLALHITYWWFILYSHVSLTEQLSLSTPEPVRDLSIKMCARATEKLVQLFNTFDKQFGLKNFPRNLIKSIFACGSALVTERDSASSASRKKRATATEGIDVCIYALKAVGDRWLVAMRMSQELETLAGVNSPN